jgi:hypothetical protein
MIECSISEYSILLETLQKTCKNKTQQNMAVYCEAQHPHLAGHLNSEDLHCQYIQFAIYLVNIKALNAIL